MTARVMTLIALTMATPAVSAELETDDQKTMYALGQMIASQLASFALTADELEFFKAGLIDGVLGNDSKIDIDTYRPKINELARARAKAVAAKEGEESAAWVEARKNDEGVVATESGLLFSSIRAGSGAAPKPTDKVKVHYHGTLRDGTVFDSSVQRGTPAEFALNRVIPCWTEGLKKMKVGGKARLICPATIAYGDRGAPPKIRPGAALSFEVELIEIQGQ